MKLTYAFIFTLYVLYNVLYNNKTNNFAVTVLKPTKTNTTKKQFYDMIRRKRKNYSTRHRNKVYQSYLVWLLVLSGDYESNP